MTNIPYEEKEKQIWLNSISENNSETLRNDRFRSALRIDVFLKNDRSLINDILTERGFEPSNDGLYKYLDMWINIMRPEYIIVKHIPS